MKIAPLHVVTGYSFLQSGLTIDKLAKSFKQNHYYGMGISDRDVMYGIAPFVSLMKKIEAPFVVGEQFEVEGDQLCLYVINEQGYHNLMDINLRNASDTLTLDYLKDHSEGLVAIIETVRGTFKAKFEEGIDACLNALEPQLERRKNA